jgi:hypothetical protein
MRWAVVLPIGIFAMAYYSPARELIVQDAAAQTPVQKRLLPNMPPDGPQDWDALDRETDRWLGTQQDGLMSVLELSAKRATGQISEAEFNESIDILTGNTIRRKDMRLPGMISLKEHVRLSRLLETGKITLAQYEKASGMNNPPPRGNPHYWRWVLSPLLPGER